MNEFEGLFSTLSTMTVVEFKNLKRAIRILTSAGIPFEEAIRILLEAKNQKVRFK